MQKDKIIIRDLEIYGHHGVYREENVLGQKFLVSAVLLTDVRKAGKTDDINYSISYADVSHFVKDFMKKHTFKLIEAVAEHLAEEILLRFPLVEEVEIEVKKPWAPILLPLDTVSVKINRGWHGVYLGIGSNMGDKEANLREAIRLLAEEREVQIVRVSDFIVTAPVGEVEQDDFLNGALKIRTLWTPEELLNRILEIESQLKRVRIKHWGPRTIDLDILLYDQEVIQTDRLTIPHMEMHKRGFVLEPLSSIAPFIRHPVLDKTIGQLLEGIR